MPPKHEKGTPKQIANKWKAKGLQKLRFWCELCKKQCRDANGFKCHMESETHLRQAELAAANPDKFIGDYSQRFEEKFLDMLRRRYQTRWVRANNAYQEYIQDKEHLHMTATIWATLTDFVKYLGRKGHCQIDQDERGDWYISWIQRDRDLLARQAAMDRKRKMEVDDETRHNARLDELVAQAREVKTDEAPAATTVDWDQAQSMRIAIPARKRAGAPAATAPGREETETDKEKDDDETAADGAPVRERKRRWGRPDSAMAPPAKRSRSANESSSSSHRAAAALDDLLEQIEGKNRTNGAENGGEAHRKVTAESEEVGRVEEAPEGWLLPGIVVKVKHRKLGGGQYHGKKGVVESLESSSVGHIRMQDSGDLLRLKQSFLETVVPKPGKEVVLLRGEHRGVMAVVDALHVDRYCATLVLAEGPQRGHTVPHVEYEAFSRAKKTR